MRCRDAMTSPVVTCNADETAAYAAARMLARKVGFIPVCGADGRVVGTVTDRDLTVRVLAECFLNKAPSDARLFQLAPLRLVMTRGPVTCKPDDDLDIAEGLMRRYHKSRIICVDDARRPVGVISVTDLANRVSPVRLGELLRALTEVRQRGRPPETEELSAADGRGP